MGFKDEFDSYQKETNSDGGFYKFTVGEHKMRIFSEPVRKDSRFGFGICYPGAKYCDPIAIEKENQEKIRAYEDECAKVIAAGGNPKSVKEPSKSNTNTKWSVWAKIRSSGNFAIVDLSKTITEKLYAFMTSDEYGFQTFPMPYDINVIVSVKKGVKNPTKKDVEYDLICARANTPVTEEEQFEFEKLTPISQIIEKMQSKQRDRIEGTATAAPIEYPEDDINAEDIPF